MRSTDRSVLAGFRRFVVRQMKEWRVPGVGVVIVKDGRTLCAEGFGYRDVAKRLPVTPQTLFAIGSCSKAFTTLVMGMLVDEGKLEWDKPVREYLPDFALHDRFATERLTPRDLVTHRSGLPRHDAVWYGSSASRQELFQRLRYLEPSKDLRTTYQYQNLMFMTAGYLVGQLTGSTWEEQVRQRIFTPLGMKSSNFSVVDSQQAADFALPYIEQRKRLKRIPFRNIDSVGPAGSINSTIADMSRWVQFHLDKGRVGRKQLVSRENLRQMHTPQMIAGQSQYEEIHFPSYGLGWGIELYRGHELISHSGGIDGFTSRTSFLPAHGIGIVVLTNQVTPLPHVITNGACDRFLGLKPLPWSRRFRKERDRERKNAAGARKKELTQRCKGTRPSHPLKDYAGDFQHPGYGIVSVRKEGKNLFVNFNDRNLKASHFHYDVFEIRETMGGNILKASFSTDAAGRIASLSCPLQEGTSDIVFTRVPDEHRV